NEKPPTLRRRLFSILLFQFQCSLRQLVSTIPVLAVALSIAPTESVTVITVAAPVMAGGVGIETPAITSVLTSSIQPLPKTPLLIPTIIPTPSAVPSIVPAIPPPVIPAIPAIIPPTPTPSPTPTLRLDGRQTR